MAQDGSDMVQMCPHEANTDYLQRFRMVPEVAQDGPDTVQMCQHVANAYY